MEYENDIITTDTDEEVVKPQKSNGQLKREYQQFTDYSTSKSKKDYEEYEIIQTLNTLLMNKILIRQARKLLCTKKSSKLQKCKNQTRFSFAFVV